jgi:deoxyribonuclease V
MKIKHLHDWPTDYHGAVAVQERLRPRLKIRPLPTGLSRVAGADVSYNRNSDRMHAGIVVMTLPDLEVVERAAESIRVAFPYIPGLLSFREAPALLEAFRKLRTRPEAVIFDGQGLAHMRGLGLAAHVGLWLGIPSVGCAKSRLVGEHRPVGRERGRRARLWYEGRIVGSVVRTRDAVQPVYVSPGHLSDIQTSVRLVLRCCRGYRLPETTRAAHRFVNEVRSAS